ncbi:AlpA family transcriptional regulator [Azoarcus sp. KH32C]|nr:AlpA family phage regulatory protein [Azoarcus sp. KH32C]
MKTITKQDVVTELGISDRTLENWMRQKKFPTPVKFGKCGLRTAE